MSENSYIGASDALKIYPENTVDFISVQTAKVQYRLSQDVPGGYEGNVLVVKNGAVLQPELDYAIDYSNIDQKNNLITFNVSLSLSDQIYVVHKGVATYNMAPSPRSVTDDSLSENLRSFVLSKFDGDGIETDFTILQKEYYPRSLLVYVDGSVQRPYIDASDEPDKWDFKLEQIDETSSKIVFRLAPAAGNSNICVLHLAFSTVLRRSDYLTSATITPNMIETHHIADNAVDDEKILLGFDEFLRGLDSDSIPRGIIKISIDNKININDKILLDGTSLEPQSLLNLGSASKPWGTGFINELDIEQLAVDNITVNTELVVEGTTELKDDVQIGSALDPVNVDIQGDVVNITANTFTVGGVSLESVPLGVIFPYYGTVLPGGVDTKYLFCDGSDVPDDVKYDDFKAWLILQGFAAPIPPNKHKVPDLINRFPYGGTGLPGGIVGSSTHSHSIDDHNHALSSVNAPIVDSGHIHSVSGVVNIPSHTHFLNSHTHRILNHRHSHEYVHYHNINLVSQSGGSHSHNVKVSDVNLSGTAERGIANWGSGVNRVTSSHDGHTHVVSGKTDGGGTANWGGSTGDKWTINTQYHNGTSWVNGEPTTEPSPLGTNWNQTRYNKSDNTDPGNMSVQTATAVNLTSGAAASSQAQSSISGVTENKTSLTTQTASSLPPGLILNFIIRAIP